MRRRAATLALVLAAVLALSTAAWAFWTTDGGGGAAASVGTLDAAAISAPATSTGSVVVTWTQQASVPGSPQAGASISYRVERRLGTGSYAAVGTGGCAGALPHGTASCTDTVTASGSYAYRVVADFADAWTATSNEAGPVVVATADAPPTVQSIVRVGDERTNASPLQWTVTFSEPVTGVDTADFALAASGVTGASITGVTGIGDSRTVTANSGTGTGSLGLDVVDNDTIRDLALNPLGGPGTAGAGNGSFTGEAYAIDRAAPAVTVTAPANGSTVRTGTPTFSGAAGDAALDGASVTVNVHSGNNTNGAIVQTATVTRTGATWAHTAAATLPAGTYTVQATQSDGLNTGAAASTFTVAAPQTPSGVAASARPAGDILVSWTQVAGVEYKVSRALSNGGPYTLVATVTAPSYTDPGAGLTGGTQYFYRVVATAGGLDSASSSTVSATSDKVAPPAPTAATIDGGGGTTDAACGTVAGTFINSAIAASVNFDVTMPSGSSPSDTVTLTVADSLGGTVAQTVASRNGAGNVNVNGVDTSSLADGTVTLTATASDAAGNTSGSVAATRFKDTLAPAVPTLTAAFNDNTAPAVDTITGTGAECRGAVVAARQSGSGGPSTATATADTAGNYTLTLASLTTGNVRYRIRVTDRAGNTTAAAGEAVVNTTATR